jgi:hypothetical protein
VVIAKYLKTAVSSVSTFLTIQLSYDNIINITESKEIRNCSFVRNQVSWFIVDWIYKYAANDDD